jgi:valyl-tRNA synthetase
MGSPILQRLAYGSEVLITSVSDLSVETQGMVTVTTYAAKIQMPLAELVDLEKERARVNKEIMKNQAELDKLQNKLENPGFIAKAPESVIAAEREKCEKLSALLQKLKEQLDHL